jgi:nucleotide-binding universal stress UspA family protein
VRRILVPVDGSPRALNAITHLIRAVNRAFSVGVHLVNVQRLVMQGDFALNVAVRLEVRTRLAAAQEVLDQARALLDAAGMPCRATVLFGDPAEAIARYADDHGFDAIVMGTRGASGALRASVASRVVSLTDVPVTLVKSGRQLRARPAFGRLVRTERERATEWAAPFDIRASR